VPPPLTPTEKTEPPPLDVLPVMGLWVRGALVGIALALTAVFVVAAALNPYRDDGEARRMETHRQMGLPECTFKQVTRLPCPSCGMTTSFALTVRADPRAFQANCVGALLALTCLAAVPWCLASAWRQRTVFFRSGERTLIGMVIGLLTLMVLRWAVVLLIMWARGSTEPPGF
jgi:hypothetical protein